MTEDEIGRAAETAWHDRYHKPTFDLSEPGLEFKVPWGKGFRDGYEARQAEVDGHRELIQHLHNEANAARSAQETEWRAKLSWKERAEAAEALVKALEAELVSYRAYWRDREAQVEAAQAEVAALTAQVAALGAEKAKLRKALMRIESDRADLGRVAAFNEAFYRVKTVAMEALATDPERGVTLTLSPDERDFLLGYLADDEFDLSERIKAKLRARATDAPERGSRGL